MTIGYVKARSWAVSASEGPNSTLDVDPLRRRWLARAAGIGAVGALAFGVTGCGVMGTRQPELPSRGPVSPAPPPAGPTWKPWRKPRFGLALGGGAARGFAHIGVIQALEEALIKPDLVVGTSAGSVVAALYASGMGASELARVAGALDEGTLADWTFPGRGVLRGEALSRFVRQHTRGRLIEQMPMPLGIMATALDNGDPVLFRRGDPGEAVRASSAVPAVFQPVRIAGREYVDGGLVAPVPVRAARQMGADYVLAVDISSPPDGGETGDAFRMLLQTFSIMGRSLNTWELAQADVVLRPALAGIASTDFVSRKKSMDSGREAARAHLGALRAHLTPPD